MAPPRGARASRSPTAALRPEEKAVLTLLRRRVREEKKGGALASQLRRSLRLVRGGKARVAAARASRGGVRRVEIGKREAIR